MAFIPCLCHRGEADQCRPDALNHTMAHVLSLLEMMPSTYVWPYVHAVSGLYGHGIGELRASISQVAAATWRRPLLRVDSGLPHLEGRQKGSSM